MKKVFLVLIMVVLFASCEKETGFLSVEIVSIDDVGQNSIITYRVINEADFNVSANLVFKMRGKEQIGWESLCKTYNSNSNDVYFYEATGFVLTANAYFKKCE